MEKTTGQLRAVGDNLLSAQPAWQKCRKRRLGIRERLRERLRVWRDRGTMGLGESHKETVDTMLTKIESRPVSSARGRRLFRSGIPLASDLPWRLGWLRSRTSSPCGPSLLLPSSGPLTWQPQASFSSSSGEGGRCCQGWSLKPFPAWESSPCGFSLCCLSLFTTRSRRTGARTSRLWTFSPAHSRSVLECGSSSYRFFCPRSIPYEFKMGKQ